MVDEPIIENNPRDLLPYLADDREKVMVSMIKYGDKFVKQLGMTIGQADPVNTRKIKHAFHDEWDKHLKMYDEYIKDDEYGDTK